MNAVVREWLTMSRAELDDIFRAASAGTPPRGEIDGTIIISGTRLSYFLARLIRALVWRGKVFDMSSAQRGMLVNRITPFSISAVSAEVYFGDSWLDGKKAIILDYSKTSFIASRIRDEIREVEPGLYLGKVWWRAVRLFDFALTSPDSCADRRAPKKRPDAMAGSKTDREGTGQLSNIVAERRSVHRPRSGRNSAYFLSILPATLQGVRAQCASCRP